MMQVPRPKPQPEPWKPVPYDKADCAAIQAVSRGEGTKDQQQRAIEWIIDIACDRDGMSYRPGSEGRRDTDFAEGRRFVGNQVVKLQKIKLSIFDTEEETK